MDRRLFRTFRGQRGSFMPVTAENWHTVSRRILAIEQKSFVPSIREDERDLAKVASSPSGIVLAALVAREEIAGYAAADELERFHDVPGVKQDRHYGHRDTIYLSSVAVDPVWRGRGIGVALEREIIAIAYKQGCSRITAHIRSAARLGDQLSAKVLGTHLDWYRTGLSFDYVVIDVGEVRARAHG